MQDGVAKKLRREEEQAAAATQQKNVQPGKEAETEVEEEKKKKKEKEKKKKKKEKKKMDNKKGKGNPIKEISDSTKELTPSVYFVVRHAGSCPGYSVYKIKGTLKASDQARPVPCRVKYLAAQRRMSFTAVRSEERPWIVGVGGFSDLPSGGPAQTIMFDCKKEVVAQGPRPRACKHEPVVVAVGDKVYALARTPSLWRKQSDYPPWFEVLDLSSASCVDGRLANCSWRPLPSPPLFSVLHQDGAWNDVWSPISEVQSYIVVDHYILFYILPEHPCNGQGAGTVAFDTRSEEWLHVRREMDLPFMGEAVPYGDLFLGRCRIKDCLTAYDICMMRIGMTNSSALFIKEVPVTFGNTSSHLVMAGQFFFCLGSGVICSVGSSTEGLAYETAVECDGIYIKVHSPINAEEGAEVQQARKVLLSSNPNMYAFTVEEPSHKLIAPPVVAALHI